MTNYDYLQNLTDLRRKFHVFPEIAYKEVQTQAKIITELDKMGVSYEKVGTGVIAKINMGKQKTIAFRADIDALPINEINDVPYKSQNPGFMHACGHDGHIALLLTFIKYCTLNPDKMGNNAVFIFQPAEEAEGGAIKMIEYGAIDEVDEIYAIHVDPQLPEGTAGLKDGVSMAGAYEFDIEIIGESCHCAEKQLGKDALHALTGVIENAYSEISKLKTKSLFHCGKLCGGYARNIVADRMSANCTIRYFQEKDLDNILTIINTKLKQAEELFGVKCEIKLLTNYIPLVNNSECNQKVKKYIKTAELPLRFSAEDFAFYLKEIKGCIIWLGTKDGAVVKKLHSPDFDFNEKALLHGLELYKQLIKENING